MDLCVDDLSRAILTDRFHCLHAAFHEYELHTGISVGMDLKIYAGPPKMTATWSLESRLYRSLFLSIQ